MHCYNLHLKFNFKIIQCLINNGVWFVRTAVKERSDPMEEILP
jgi:hypothetical protein